MSAPQAIFKWVRGEIIGEGAARVYLALNSTTGEMVAAKQVETQNEGDQRKAAMVETLKNESEVIKGLQHPNVIQYLGFEETPRYLSIFLEYVPSGSIKDCMNKHGVFHGDVTKFFISQILNGLEYVHAQNILHGDLKTSSILVENSGVCKISGFGRAKRTDIAADETLLGTIFWMAPEFVKASKSKIDIWSLGCVVLEMQTAKRPWQGESIAVVMRTLCSANCTPPIPEGVTLSPSAQDFVMRCLAYEAEARPTASELRKHPYLDLPEDWAFSGSFTNA